MDNTIYLRKNKDTIDIEIISIIEKLNKLGIITKSSCSGCGLSHLFRRNGFIQIKYFETDQDVLMRLFSHIYVNPFELEIPIVKFVARSRVSTMISALFLQLRYRNNNVSEEPHHCYYIKVLGNWWKFGYDIKKFWKYLENILYEMINNS